MCPDLDLIFKVNNPPPQFHFCEPEWSWKTPPLRDYTLWFIVSGRGEARLGAQKFDLHRGACFVWRPGDAPFATHDREHRLVVFATHFEPPFEPPTADVTATATAPDFEFAYPVTVHDIPFFEATAQRIESLWRRDEASRQEAQRLARALLWQLHDDSRGGSSLADAPFRELASHIRREPARSWTIEEMARITFLSRAHFVRRFQEVFGDSPAHFVQQIRLQRAFSLVLESQMSIQQIAAALGFCDAAHFSRAFKACYGTGPSSARRRARNSEG